MKDGQGESLRATQNRQAAERLLEKVDKQPSDSAEAIRLAEAAVEVHRRTGPAEECAASWYVLGTAWWIRPDGEREDNHERALDAMMMALAVRSRVGPPVEWALVVANIGALYWMRASADRVDNIERAISAWHAAAEIFSRHVASEKSAEQWVHTTENLATGYLRRKVGERSQNVDAAVAAIESIAEFHSDRGQRVAWARARRWLANTLIEHRPVDDGSHIEQAIDIITDVLHTGALTGDELASAEVDLALAHLHRVQGDRQDAIARAATYCRSALARHSPGDSAVVAQANATLGALHVTQGSNGDSVDIEASIEYLRNAATMFKRTGPLKEYAKAQFNLGHAYSVRAADNPRDNQEQAIAAWTEAGRAFTHAQVTDHEFPEFSSQIDNALGMMYMARLAGDHGDNVEHAIAAFWRATLPFPEDSRDSRLGVARHNLGAAYLERSTGDKIQNLVKAREALEAASRTRTRQRVPLDWALTETTLGIVYAKLAELGQGDHLADRAVAAHRGALEVVDPEHHATHWRQACSNLASAYLVRSRGGRPQDVDKAIAVLTTVVEMMPDSAPSAEWFVACQGLGAAYYQRDRGNRGADAQRAVQVWQTCLARHEHVSLPGLRRTTARALGNALSELGRWKEAAHAYTIAVEATNDLYRAALLADSQSGELESAGDSFVGAAYAMVRADPSRAADAVLMLERGRGRSLAEQLSRDAIEQAVAESGDARLHASYSETLAGLREIEAVLRDGSAMSWLVSRMTGAPPDLTDTPESRRVAERLLASMAFDARKRLGDMAERVLATSDGSHAALDLANLAAAITPEVPVAYLVCTPFGSLMLALSTAAGEPTAEALLIDDFDESRLHRALGLSRGRASGTPGYLLGQLGGESPMKPYVQKLLADLGSRLILPLAQWLARQGATGVVLIPTGRLGLLPLHAVSVAPGRCLVDDFVVSYAPSLSALGAARKAAADKEHGPRRLAGVADSTMDRHLRWARAELAQAAGHFDTSKIHSGGAATKATLLEAARDASHVHLACHGRYDLAEPLSSGLVLVDGTLTLGDVLRDRPFASARLVVASACQTAVSEFLRLPDEVFGLPMAFLAAGTPAVIGTLWPTDDLAAALLMARFYRGHLRDALPPAAALRAAQLWLRALTGEQLVAEIKALSPTTTAFGVSEVLDIAAQEPDERFYADPKYWAPFVLIGA